MLQNLVFGTGKSISTDFSIRAQKVLMEIMACFCFKETEVPKFGNVSEEIKIRKINLLTMMTFYFLWLKKKFFKIPIR